MSKRTSPTPGPLALVAGNRTAHVEALCEDIVLSHVLNDAERALGALTVSFDLAGFGRVEELSFNGLPVEPVSAEPGHIAWMGPGGWLDQFAIDATLAVRVGADGAIDLEPLAASPSVHAELVAMVRRVYDETVEEPQLPVCGEKLVFGLLADDRAIFATPRPPLSVLCDAAGLEREASAVVHDAEIWGNQRILARMHRVSFEAGDRDLALQVLEILELID